MSGFGNYNAAMINQCEAQINMYLEIKRMHIESRRKAKGLMKLKYAYWIAKCTRQIKKLYKWKIKLI